MDEKSRNRHAPHTTSLQTMEDALAGLLMPQRMGAALLSLFGILSLVLAAVGIYGVVGYSVSRESRNIGIRIALGASKQDVLALVVWGMAVPVLLGLVAGSASALALTSTIASFMFGISPGDPLTFAVIIAVLGGVALVATLIPARRAARLDPMRVLATE